MSALGDAGAAVRLIKWRDFSAGGIFLSICDSRNLCRFACIVSRTASRVQRAVKAQYHVSTRKIIVRNPDIFMKIF